MTRPSLLDNRNKLISIAYRDGWDVVEYFEADPLTKNDGKKRNFVSRARKQRGLRKNSLRSKMGTLFKSQSTFSKSGPSVNFGQSHIESWIFARMSVMQFVVNPVPEKKASIYSCLIWLRQSRPFHRGHERFFSSCLD